MDDTVTALFQSPVTSLMATSHKSLESPEEEDLFVLVFNNTLEGPRAPAVKAGRITQA